MISPSGDDGDDREGEEPDPARAGLSTRSCMARVPGDLRLWRVGDDDREARPREGEDAPALKQGSQGESTREKTFRCSRCGWEVDGCKRGKRERHTTAKRKKTQENLLLVGLWGLSGKSA